MRSPTVQAAGIVYLQDELYEFQLYEGGHVWSVYGSPVAFLPSLFGPHLPPNSYLHGSGNHISAIGLSTIIQGTKLQVYAV
jgi:hypothetical protein